MARKVQILALLKTGMPTDDTELLKAVHVFESTKQPEELSRELERVAFITNPIFSIELLDKAVHTIHQTSQRGPWECSLQLWVLAVHRNA